MFHLNACPVVLPVEPQLLRSQIICLGNQAYGQFLSRNFLERRKSKQSAGSFSERDFRKDPAVIVRHMYRSRYAGVSIACIIKQYHPEILYKRAVHICPDTTAETVLHPELFFPFLFKRVLFIRTARKNSRTKKHGCHNTFICLYHIVYG